MASIKSIDIISKEIWERFVISKNPESFLQSWNWGETHKNMGCKIFRKGFYNNGELVGVMQLIDQKAKRGHHLILPGGPLLDLDNPEYCKVFRNEINKISIDLGAWFVRIRPELVDTKENRDLFNRIGFIRAPMHLYAENTRIIPINKSDEEILLSMRKNTRYSIRKSWKQGFKLEITTDPEKVELLYTLQKNTVKRHGFVGFSKKIFQEQLRTFGKDHQAALFLIKDPHDKVHVAAIIIFYGKRAYYHHSASSEESRHNYAAYFLQWSVIQEAKRRGCEKYNLWGVSPDMHDKKHRFYGVTVFKQGFGGEKIDWLPAHDYHTSLLYWTTYGFECIRKLQRRL